MLSGQADLKSPYGHIVKIPINLIKHFPVPVRICFQGFPLSHDHGQQRVQGPRNPATSDKTSSKRPSKLLKGINGAFLQAIKPPHCHKPQIGWEHLTHQGFILGVNSHPLVEVAYMLHRVCSTIIHCKCRLSEPPRKFSSFNFACKKWFGNLVQFPTHSIIS